VPRFESRAFGGAQELPLLIEFTRRASAARLPRRSYYHPGDICWQLRGNAETQDVRLWTDGGGRAVAFATLEPPVHMAFDVQPGLEDDLLPLVLSWAEGRARELQEAGEQPVPIAYQHLAPKSLSTTALASDLARQRFLESRGYRRAAEGGGVWYEQALEGAEEPAMPPGFVARGVRDDELEARVELHRDAWSVWGPSSFSLEAYLSVRGMPSYDPELDIVLEGPDGRLVAYCTGWPDAELGTGLFEPVGVRPAEAGRGFGRTVMLETMRRMGELGLRTALVGTAVVNTRARRLYPACGFVEVDRDYVWQKPLTAS
jgi:ribosomal protein S18 acetylase RimI-like enzyme